MAIKFYAGVRVDTGRVVTLMCVSSDEQITGLGIQENTTEDTNSYIISSHTNEADMLKLWDASEYYSLVELKDFKVLTLFEALQPIATKMLEEER